MNWSKIYRVEDEAPEVRPWTELLDGFEQSGGTAPKVFTLQKTESGQSVSFARPAPLQSLGGHELPLVGTGDPRRSELDRLLLEARQKMESINREAEYMEKEAYEKGFEQGEKAGRQLGEQKLEVALRNFEQVLNQLSSIHQELFQREEQKLIELAYRIAEKVVHHEVQTNRETVAQIAEAVLRKTVQEKIITLHLNPQDVEIFEQHQQKYAELQQRAESLLIKADPNVQRGGCIAVTPDGEINATIENQLAHVRNELLGK